MKGKRILPVMAVALALVCMSAASIHGRDDRNLKVLPKDISDEDLDKIMDEFTDALGVKCNYCHAPRKDNVEKLDFASDDKAAKKIAREMMLMTIGINKQYFKDHVDMSGKASDAVSCITCHNGEEYPAFKKP